MKCLKLIFFTGLVLLGFNAHAGAEGRGGADTIENKNGGRSLLDLQEIDDLRYFNFLMQNYSKKISEAHAKMLTPCFGSLCDEQYVNSSLELFSYPQLINELFQGAYAVCSGIIKAKDSKGWLMYRTPVLQWAFTNSNLEDIKDEGVMRVFNPNTKRQVAIQKDGLVIINEKEFNLMDNDSKAALKLHESALCAVKALNPELLEFHGTAPVRNFVRQFVSFALTQDKAESTSFQSVVDAADALTKNLPKELNLGTVSISKADKHECIISMYPSKQNQPSVALNCTYPRGSFISKMNGVVTESGPLYDKTIVKIAIHRDATVLNFYSELNEDHVQNNVKTIQLFVKNNYEDFLKAWNDAL